MPYSPHFIRCRLRATYTHDRETGEIGLKLGREDGGDPLPIAMPSRDAVRLLLYWLDDLTASGLPEDLRRIALMTDEIAASVARKPAATPIEDNEIDALVSALAALTDRVRALEERAEPQASAPLDFGHDGTMYVSPAVIPKVSTVEQAIADEADESSKSAAKLYDEITRITTEPSANLLARIEALENAVCTLDVRQSDAEANVDPEKVLYTLRARSARSFKEPRP